MATTSQTDPKRAAKAAMKRANISQDLRSYKPDQVERAAGATESMTGEKLRRFILGDGDKGSARKGNGGSRKSYPAAVLEVHAVVLDLCKKYGIGKALVPKQTAAVIGSVSDTTPADATGLSMAQLTKWAKGERPADPEKAKGMREFITAHPKLRKDANLGPRKVAVALVAIDKQS